MYSCSNCINAIWANVITCEDYPDMVVGCEYDEKPFCCNHYEGIQLKFKKDE